MNLHVLDDEDSEGSLRVPDNLKVNKIKFSRSC
jgi:hypothetical protein